MNVRPLALALLLASCASAPARPVEAEPAPLQSFDYSTAIRAVPAGASRVAIRVRIPDVWPTGALRPVGVHGLVGNASFESRSPGLALFPGTVEGKTSYVVPEDADDRPRIAWTAGEEDGVGYREVLVESTGKPLEISVRVDCMAGAPVERAELERKLVSQTTATVDGVAVDALAVHLREVN